MIKKVLIWIFFILSGFACETNPTGINPSDKLLQVEDVEVTDAWLKVTLSSAVAQSLTLYRNGQPLLSFPRGPVDTTVIDGSLLPNHNYTYTLSYPSAFGYTVDVNKVNITTMDTTSHNMRWYVDTIAGGSFTDVAIVNDTLIYAVGNLFTKDPISQFDTVPWNTAIWNGQSWSLQVVYVQIPVTPPYPPGYCKCNLEGAVVLSSNDIWFTNWNQIIRWGGSSVANYSYAQGSLAHLWASSENNVYGVGTDGDISHYNCSDWKKLVSGTTTTVQDVWGSLNSDKKTFTILCAVSEINAAGDSKILKIDKNDSASVITEYPPYAKITSIWFNAHHTYFLGMARPVVGYFNLYWSEPYNIPVDQINRIRGTEINDVFAVGDNGLCAHFNGMTWKYYPEMAATAGGYYGLAVTKSMVVAVGGINMGHAVILRGYRQ